MMLAMVVVVVLQAVGEGVSALQPLVGGWWLPLALAFSFGVILLWLLMEPLVDAWLVTRKLEGREAQQVELVVKNLSSRLGISPPRVLVFQSNKLSALAEGLGSSQTILVSSAVAQLPDELLEAVLAHELGHLQLGHHRVRLVVFTMLFFYVVAQGDAILNVVAANVAFLWLMRRMEYQADAYASGLVGWDAMVRALLYVKGAVGDVPSWQCVISSHPSFAQRLRRLPTIY
jgi:Zn-dependent protease with chaperone function